MKCYVFDLDGTLANLDHRLWYIQKPDPDWRGFFRASKDDAPIKPILDLICDLTDHADGAHVIIFSGRSDEVRFTTIHWLLAHEIHCEALYMRKEGDHRPDHIIKKELLDQALADGWEPILFIDDRKQVVDMWRSLGYVCLQCAPGDF
jgi:hypothetical protein